MTDRVRGFTLIELMITVAILGIIVAVGYPAYGNYVRGSICEAAKTSLLDGAAQMENKLLTAGGLTSTSSITLSSPSDSDAQFTIACAKDEAVDNNALYKCTATPNGKRFAAGSGTITLDGRGQKSGTGIFAQAWTSCKGI